MSEQDLHDAEVDPLLQESGRKAVAKRVRSEVGIETTGRPGRVEGPANRLPGNVRAVLAVGKEPLGALMDLPDLAEHGKRRLGEGQGAFLVAFTDDPKEHPLRVDG